MFLPCTVLVLLNICSGYSAKILGVFNIPSVSHQIVYQPLWKELSLRGHEVTVITPNPLKDPTLTNLTEIDLSFMYDTEDHQISEDVSKGIDHWEFMKLVFELSTGEYTEGFLRHKEVHALINDTSKEFNVVIAEYMLTFTGAFAVRFKCPLIGIAPINVLSTTNVAIGNPVHPILHPDYSNGAEIELSLFQRVDFVLFAIWERYYHHFVEQPKLDKIVKKYFGDDMPYIGDMEGNVSMLFLNTNPLIHQARPYLPSVVTIGRMHIKPKKALPQVSLITS